MPHIHESPPAGGADGLGNVSCLVADGSENSNSRLHVQETIAALQRDFVAEALRIAALKAWHAAEILRSWTTIAPSVGSESLSKICAKPRRDFVSCRS
jgi:hypothetical protein